MTIGFQKLELVQKGSLTKMAIGVDSEGLVDQGGDWNRFKANLDVPSVALRHLSGENLGTVLKIKVA